jgi:hypothetical protein
MQLYAKLQKRSKVRAEILTQKTFYYPLHLYIQIGATNITYVRLVNLRAYFDRRGKMVTKVVGSVWSYPRKGIPQNSDNKTLDELHFETGDYLDVAILNPKYSKYEM